MIQIEERLKLSLLLIEKEKTVAKLKHDINKDVEKKVHDQHRKFLLNEQVILKFLIYWEWIETCLVYSFQCSNAYTFMKSSHPEEFKV